LRLYETTFITDAQLSDAEIETEVKKVEELITANGGEIVEIQRWGIRRLAYEIKHKRQGFYTHFLYRALPGLPAQIESAFKVNERIVRFITVVSEVDLEARAQQQEALEAAAAQIVIPPAATSEKAVGDDVEG
jgi:small subunit ribosomal protein S6